MKAVVVELKDGRAAVLAPDGAVNFIKDENYTVGQFLDIDTAPVPVKLADYVKKHSTAAAAAAVAFVVAGSAFAVDGYACTTVTLDVNPSVKYTLNAFDKVLDVEAYNDDGNVILNKMEDVKGKSFERAVEETLDIMEEDTFINGDTDAVITVSSRFGSDARIKRKASGLVDQWNGQREDSGKSDSVKLEIVELTEDLVDKANKENKTPGRIYMEEKEAEEKSGTGNENGALKVENNILEENNGAGSTENNMPDEKQNDVKQNNGKRETDDKKEDNIADDKKAGNTEENAGRTESGKESKPDGKPAAQQKNQQDGSRPAQGASDPKEQIQTGQPEQTDKPDSSGMQPDSTQTQPATPTDPGSPAPGVGSEQPSQQSGSEPPAEPGPPESGQPETGQSEHGQPSGSGQPEQSSGSQPGNFRQPGF